MRQMPVPSSLKKFEVTLEAVINELENVDSNS